MAEDNQSPQAEELEPLDDLNDAQPDRGAMPVDREPPPRLEFPVCGVGASAGGLEAFTEFFKNMRPDSGMAFVLIQHLPPDRESMIAEILSRHTQMPVFQVTDGMKVQRDHVYVIRPGHTLTIKDGLLHLGERLEKPGNNRPVDDFFKSLAEEQRERSICILLSGMGSNGTAGAQSIKAAGGLCIAQDPETAQFPSMPRHLIEAGYADYILQTSEMPAVLLEYIKHPYVSGDGDTEAALRRDRQHVREILAILRTRARQDFSGYKKPTVIRRIQRRMGLNHLTTLSEYARILRQSPTEVQALADDLLIHVTGFFRDPEAWEALRTRVVAPMIAARDGNANVRCWVTACSSGEEAYSLAIMLIEEAERARKPLDIKVFATDTSERMLASARNGVYPGGIEAELTPERLERFFQKEDAVYRVRQELRQVVVFAPQNVLQDPPFSRLDIVTCRNLLIYLEPNLQARVLAVLHFGLRDGGALFLGTSETIADSDDQFELIDKKTRIFRRIGPTRRGTFDFPLPRPAVTSIEAKGGNGRPSLAQLTNAALLARHVPAAVTVDRELRIVYYHGNTQPFLEQPTGEPTRDILATTIEGVRGAVRIALQRAMAENGAAVVLDGFLGEGADRRRIAVTASPLDVKAVSDFFVVSFEERAEPVEQAAPAEEAGMARELLRVRQELQSTIHELQASNEEHRASAEEVMSMNEELQSTNEELETSREEMQSLNEELTTVNAQLQSKMEEYLAISNDLGSLLSSTDIAVLFLDQHFTIRRFTPAVKDLVELIATDIGRPLSDMAWKFADQDLIGDAQSVMEKLVPREKEVHSDSGRWYIRRVLPYRTVDNRIDGLVITFVDISERRRMVASLAERARLLDLSNDIITVRDLQNRIIYWNQGAAELFGWTSDEAIGRDQQKLLRTEQEDPIDALVQKLQTQERLIGEVVHHTRDGRRIITLCRWAVDRDADNKPLAILTTATDITEHKKGDNALIEAKRAAEAANRMKDEFLATLSHELRTPLSAILLWVKLMRGKGNDSRQIEEGLAAIQNSAEAQRALIDDLLDTSRIMSGKLRLHLREVDLAPLLQDAIDAIMPAAAAKNIEVHATLQPDIGIVMVDADRVRQVAWNLLTNSVKFTPNGGEVRVALKRERGAVDIIVTDNGQGIAPEFLPYVFDRFRQADTSHTRRHGGLGLGLDISKQLVELHGGTVDANSAGSGKGATFIVHLPLAKVRHPRAIRHPHPAESSVAETHPVDANLQGKHVLLVEDDKETRQALALALRRVGAKVSGVETAAAAFESFERDRPDLIVSDIGLPEEDGYSLMQRIRVKESASGIGPVPALALTAFAREEDRQRALESGFQRHLGKPIDPEYFISALYAMLSGK